MAWSWRDPPVEAEAVPLLVPSPDAGLSHKERERLAACGVQMDKPYRHWTQAEKARGHAPPLACNRAVGHDGPHRHTNKRAEILAELDN